MPAAAKLAELPPLDDARAHLAEKSAALAAAIGYLARAREIAERATETRYAAMHTVDQVEAALKAAEAHQPRTRLAALLGEPVAAPTVDELRAELDEARRAYASAGIDIKLVEQEIARLERVVEMLGLSRDTALAAVLRPAGEALLAEYHEAGRRVVSLRLALSALGSRHGRATEPLARDAGLPARPGPCRGGARVDRVAGNRRDRGARRQPAAAAGSVTSFARSEARAKGG
jgi:hypothetical protein